MSEVQALATRLSTLCGTRFELASRLGREPGDSTFKRALAQASEDGLRSTGKVFYPIPIASGFGAAVELGIHTGRARTAFFEQAQDRLGYGVIGKGDAEIVRRYNEAHGFTPPRAEPEGTGGRARRAKT